MVNYVSIWKYNFWQYTEAEDVDFNFILPLALDAGMRYCKAVSSLDTHLTQFGCMCSLKYKFTFPFPLLYQLGYSQGSQAYFQAYFGLGKIKQFL